MLTIIISLFLLVAVRVTCIHQGLGSGESGWWGIAAFFVSMFLMGYVVRKRASKVQGELEGIMLEGQKKINRKVQQFQTKPGANPVVVQRQIEGDQKAMLQKAFDFTAKLEPFKKWNLMMGRQIATMRMQFLYQLKDFKQVDEILKTRSFFTGPLLTEPLMVAMKMAREYKNGKVERAEKTFVWHRKWFRGSRGTLLYALMSWIHLKNGDDEKARKVLHKGEDVTGNETLAKNFLLLSNDKRKQFSNRGLGEEWYSLHLEKPPNPKTKRVRGNARGHGMF